MILRFLLPGAVLSVAYAAICASSGRLWPWTVVVHEDGRRTFGQTVLYFEHAARELPLDVVLAVALAGATRYFFPPLGAAHARSQARRNRLLVPALAVSSAALAAIVAGTLWENGAGALALNLLQYYTRPGAAPDFGSHWHYHLLSRLALLLSAFCATGLYASLRPATKVREGPGGSGWYLTALAAYAGLSLVFGPRAEPFLDPVYLGHQARELFTHAVVTLPLGLGACWWVAQQLHGFSAPGSLRRPRVSVLAAGILAASLGCYLAGGLVLTKPYLQAQSQSMTRVVAVHFFEHTFTYIMVPAAACLFYLLPCRQAAGAAARRGSGHPLP